MLIGIYTYDKYELCEAIFENIIKFAKYVGCSINMARVIICKAKQHQLDYILIDGKRKRIEFINVNEDE